MIYLGVALKRYEVATGSKMSRIETHASRIK